MGLFILLFLALLSDAMVMDKKVKESFVLGTASAICNYDAYYKDHTKYWCRGYFRDYCHIIALTPNSTDRVALKDTGSQFIITVSCLTKADTGWYWCGIQRDFARDDMDFTELIVTDSRGDQTNEFWSGKDLPDNKNRSCRASRVIHKADRSRMSILIICILLTSLGIISIISHLSKRRRSQRNRRDQGDQSMGWRRYLCHGDKDIMRGGRGTPAFLAGGKGLTRAPQNSQASPVNPTSLATLRSSSYIS